MRKIQNVVDESIENMVAEPSHNEAKIIDLSGLDFDLLEQYFLKTKNKNAAVQSLKDKIEKQLKQMVERNPLQLTITNAIRKSSMNITEAKTKL
jgi:type I restriction enzyme R subunit